MLKSDDFISVEDEPFDNVQKNKMYAKSASVYISEAPRTVLVYFNKIASEMIGTKKYIDIKISPKFVVFTPSNSYLHHKLTLVNGNNFRSSCQGLRNKNLAGKYFLLYKCEYGFAIKRNEPIFTRRKEL